MTSPVTPPAHPAITRWTAHLDQHIASLPPVDRKPERAVLTKLRRADDLVTPVHMQVSQRVEAGELARRFPIGPEARLATSILKEMK